MSGFRKISKIVTNCPITDLTREYVVKHISINLDDNTDRQSIIITYVENLINNGVIVTSTKKRYSHIGNDTNELARLTAWDTQLGTTIKTSIEAYIDNIYS